MIGPATRHARGCSIGNLRPIDGLDLDCPGCLFPLFALLRNSCRFSQVARFYSIVAGDVLLVNRYCPLLRIHPYTTYRLSSHFIQSLNSLKSLISTLHHYCPVIQLLPVSHTLLRRCALPLTSIQPPYYHRAEVNQGCTNLDPG